MNMYKKGINTKHVFNKDLEKELIEFQKECMPQDTLVGIIEMFLEMTDEELFRMIYQYFIYGREDETELIKAGLKDKMILRNIYIESKTAESVEEFEKGISEGKYAGNVPEDKSRHVSYDCVGVDCSGLLTVCWELPKKISTRIIPDYANVIESIDEIQQGDVLAKVGSHVMFFKEFVDDEKKEIIIIDATRSTGKVSVRKENVAKLFCKGYKIYRKK